MPVSRPTPITVWHHRHWQGRAHAYRLARLGRRSTVGSLCGNAWAPLDAVRAGEPVLPHNACTTCLTVSRQGATRDL